MDDDFISEVIEAVPKSKEDLEKLPPSLILIVIGGYIAIGIGLFHFILSIPNEPLVPLFHFLIDLIFGVGLIVTFLRVESELITWSVIGIISSVALLALGGIVGGIAGLFGLIGVIVKFLRDSKGY